MTAKSRRRKFDKRRKTDEHPNPHRGNGAAREVEGEDGASERDEFSSGYIHSFSLVPEGQGFPGSFVTIDYRKEPERKSVYVPSDLFEIAKAQGWVDDYAKRGIDILEVEYLDPDEGDDWQTVFPDLSIEEDFLRPGQLDRGLGFHGELSIQDFTKLREREEETLRAEAASHAEAASWKPRTPSLAEYAERLGSTEFLKTRSDDI